MGISIINGISPFLNKIHFLIHSRIPIRASQVVLVVKNPPATAGDAGDSGLILGWRRFPGVRNGNPLQYSCLENPLDRGAWWSTVHGVAKGPTLLMWLSMHGRTDPHKLWYRLEVIHHSKEEDFLPHFSGDVHHEFIFKWEGHKTDLLT